jgi:DNA-binding MarR family transcriptional regulator
VQDPAPYRALVTGIEALARVQREIGTLLARELDMSRASLMVVRSLAREGEMTVGDLSAHLRVDLSVASRQISAAAEAGLVERTASDDPSLDRRVRTVRLTAAGQALAARSRDLVDALATEAFVDWTPQQLTDASAQIQRVAASVAVLHETHTRGRAAPRLVPA